MEVNDFLKMACTELITSAGSSNSAFFTKNRQTSDWKALNDSRWYWSSWVLAQRISFSIIAYMIACTKFISGTTVTFPFIMRSQSFSGSPCTLSAARWEIASLYRWLSVGIRSEASSSYAMRDTVLFPLFNRLNVSLLRYISNCTAQFFPSSFELRPAATDRIWNVESNGTSVLRAI